MSNRRWTFVLGAIFGIALVVTCGDGMGDHSGDGGLLGDRPANADNSCTPGKAFCDGNVRWVCNRSGNDASTPTDCTGMNGAGFPYTTGASPTNPAICATTSCPSFSTDGVCCRTTKPLFTYSVTSPITSSGELFSAQDYQNGEFVLISASLSKAPCDLTVAWYHSPKASESTCATAYDTLNFTLKRSMVSPGATIKLPDPAIQLSGTFVSGSCAAWTGSVHWISDVPSWQVVIDAICSENGKNLAIKATLAGNA